MESPFDKARFVDADLRPLVRFCESVYAMNHVMRGLIAESIPDWKQRLAHDLTELESAGTVAQLFKPLYESMESPERFHEAVQLLFNIKRSV